MKLFPRKGTLLLLSFFSLAGYAQNVSKQDSTTQSLPKGYYHKVEAESRNLNQQLSRATVKYLSKLSRIESRLLGKMQSVDGVASSHLSVADYQQWVVRLKDSATSNSSSHTYCPRLDSLQTTLHYLEDQKGGQTGTIGNNLPLDQATGQVQQLQARLDQSALVDQYITQRKQMISQYLSQYTHLPQGVTQAFNEYKTSAYYYRQQLEELRKSLNDPQKIEQQTISQLSKLPAYQDYMAKHSILASLFQLPSGYSGDPSLQGLQTHDQIQQMLRQQVSSGGSGGQAAVDQQMQQAQTEVSNMQNNLAKYGAAGQNLDMPNFTPNQQRSKTFLKRLTYGGSVQLSKSSSYFPATGILGLTIGYKINDKSTFGVGASYNLGLGRDWGHMQLSNQGLGFRSFMDWKIKKTYYVTGGYELNYMSSFTSIAQLRDQNFWQPSALVGLEKKYKISSKMQGNLQLLFDALYRQEIPSGQMFKFRVGYGF